VVPDGRGRESDAAVSSWAVRMTEHIENVCGDTTLKFTDKVHRHANLSRRLSGVCGGCPQIPFLMRTETWSLPSLEVPSAAAGRTRSITNVVVARRAATKRSRTAARWRLSQHGRSNRIFAAIKQLIALMGTRRIWRPLTPVLCNHRGKSFAL
jgi:hypothetical protein